MFPITVNLMYDPISVVSKSEPALPRIDWSLATRSDSLLKYQETVGQCLNDELRISIQKSSM